MIHAQTNQKRQRSGLPDLDLCLDRIVETQRPVRQAIPAHSDIYTIVDGAIEAYKIQKPIEGVQGKSANDNDFKRLLYFAAYSSIVFLLHDKSGAKSQEKFREDVVRYRETMADRLDYVDALIQAGCVATQDDKRIGFKYSDLLKWREAKGQITAALAAFSKSKKRTDDKVVQNLDKAYGILEPLKAKAKAMQAYDGGIPL